MKIEFLKLKWLSSLIVLFLSINAIIANSGNNPSNPDSVYIDPVNPDSVYVDPVNPDSVYVDPVNPDSVIFDTIYNKTSDMDKESKITSIEEMTGYNKLSINNVYPNPAYEQITFVINTPVEKEIKISFFNPIGIEVLTNQKWLNNGENEISVNISSLPKGNYIYRIVVGNEILNGNLIVK